MVIAVGAVDSCSKEISLRLITLMKVAECFNCAISDTWLKWMIHVRSLGILLHDSSVSNRTALRLFLLRMALFLRVALIGRFGEEQVSARPRVSRRAQAVARTRWQHPTCFGLFLLIKGFEI